MKATPRNGVAQRRRREIRSGLERLGRHVRCEPRPGTLMPPDRELYHFLAQTIREDLPELGVVLGSGLELVWTGPLRAAALRLMRELHLRAGVRACRLCGCTEERGCHEQRPGGIESPPRPPAAAPWTSCSWAAPDLCSRCRPRRRRA